MPVNEDSCSAASVKAHQTNSKHARCELRVGKGRYPSDRDPHPALRHQVRTPHHADSPTAPTNGKRVPGGCFTRRVWFELGAAREMWRGSTTDRQPSTWLRNTKRESKMDLGVKMSLCSRVLTHSADCFAQLSGAHCLMTNAGRHVGPCQTQNIAFEG